MATNYLSRFLLNGLLLDLLGQSPHGRARLVHVAAAGMPLALSRQNFPPAPTASSFTGHNLGQAANDFYGLEFAERYGHTRVKINHPEPGFGRHRHPPPRGRRRCARLGAWCGRWKR